MNEHYLYCLKDQTHEATIDKGYLQVKIIKIGEKRSHWHAFPYDKKLGRLQNEYKNTIPQNGLAF